MGRSRDVLAPQIPLSPENVSGLTGRQSVRYRLPGVDRVQWQVAADRARLRFRIAPILVEVGVVGRAHDDVVALLRRDDPALDAAPGHHRSLGRDSTFENLVPADQSPAVRAQEALDAFDEIALQLLFVLQPLTAH